MTVEEAVDRYLTDMERQRWYINNNTDYLPLHREVRSDFKGDIILSAFSWSLTPEGFDYWDDVYERVSYDTRVYTIKKPIKPIHKLLPHTLAM